MINMQGKHPADIAEHLSTLDKKERDISFLLLTSKKAEVFSYFDDQLKEEIIRSLGESELEELINSMNPDDRTGLFENFPDELIKRLVNLLSDSEKDVALNLIGYEKESIARLMTPNYIQARPNWTVEKVLDHIKRFGRKAETLNFIYVVDEENSLVDDLRIGELLLSDKNKPISELMDKEFIAIRANTHVEDAFHIFDKYDRSALPIVTDKNTLVGIVTFDDILDKIKERDTEDIQKFGGVEGLEMSYTQTPWVELVKKRAVWLIILFVGEILTASAMSYYEDEIEKAVMLALFVPLIISSGGNSGSQAASLIIRAMALREVKLADWWYVIKKELLSGLLLGAILGATGFIRILFWQKTGLYDYGEFWFAVAGAVSASLVFIVLWGTVAGAIIPFILRKVGLDPATASAPFVATFVDVTGLIIYFSIAAVFLAGKLL
ncbi:magnesium transporter [Fulvivirga maritima]|uniref:magnesium transporter n=1 Tax=Fulvivirga maritima TaxID=2904247 RepID=UPI001F41AE16|nr:magnesium transporter [Fulvivirga maritima]UII26300.1 magnesium transporter [Fulvivirga maritima]